MMDDVPMDLDGLTPVVAAGPRGVQGSLLERLEREALADAAREAAVATGATRPPNSSSSSTSSMPAYVPGAKKRRLSEAGIDAINTASTTMPASNGDVASSSLKASRSGSGGVGNNQEAPVNQHGSTSASAAPEPAPEPKIRKQPTIRMTFTWKPYPPNKIAEAKHVPIFQVHEMAEKAGFLLPPEEDTNMYDGSSSDGSDDEEGGDKADNSNDGDETVEMTESQKAIQDAIEIARRKGGPVMKRKRVRDRDEGYDVNDLFVDDSELAINEPKFVPETKVQGYCAIQGEVEIVSAADAPKKGRKAGSLNKPKVVVAMADGTTKMVSEAVAAKEKKKAAKAAEATGGGSKVGKDASASESPAPTSASAKPESKGPLMSRDTVSYSHLPSSTTNGFASTSALQGSPAPRSSTSRASVPPNSTSIGAGSRASPIALGDDDDDGDRPMSPKKHESTPAPSLAPPATWAVFSFDPSPTRNGKRVYDTHSVSQGLQKALDHLKLMVSKESFVPKNKFPPSLKAPLVEAAIQAMKNGEYDENFFDLMPGIFPYNRFTMHKMIKREVCEPRCEELEEEIAELSEKMKEEVDKVMPTMRQNYKDALKKWETDYAEWKSTNSNQGGESLQANLSRQSLTPVGSDGDISAVKPPAKDEGPAKPLRKFKFSETMRMLLYRIMTHSGEVHERKHEKAEVEEKELPSQMNAIKARYATLVKTAWPEEWMTSNQLSRELTAAKKKIEKQMNATVA